MHSQKLTIDIPDDLFNEIDKYKKIIDTPSRSKAVVNLLKYALSLHPSIKDFNWEKAEKEADEEIKDGNTKTFENVNDFLNDLKS